MDWPPLPDYGCFPRWPVDGHGFIHPDDVPLVNRLIPSERVFCRYLYDETYYHYRYGEYRFRLRPVMWLQVKIDGFDVGDLVEVVSVGLEREQFTARIWGMYHVRRKGRILYRLKAADGSKVPRLYTSDQLKQLEDKTKIRPSVTEYPAPQWHGRRPDEVEGVMEGGDEDQEEDQEEGKGEDQGKGEDRGQEEP